MSALALPLDQRRARRARRRAGADDVGGRRLPAGARQSVSRLIAVLIVLLNVVNTTGEYLVARLLTDARQRAGGGQRRRSTSRRSSARSAATTSSGSTSWRSCCRRSSARGSSSTADCAERCWRCRSSPWADTRSSRPAWASRWCAGSRPVENATDYSHHEHRASAAVAADHARGEIQGQAGDRHVLHARRRRALGGRRVCRARGAAAERRAVRHRQRRAHAGVARRRARRFSGRANLLSRLAFAAARRPPRWLSGWWLSPRPRSPRRRAKKSWRRSRREKATQLHPYEPDAMERRIERIGSLLNAQKRPIYPFIGSVFAGGGLALGPGYRSAFGDTGHFDAHAAWSIRNYKRPQATVRLPTFADGRITGRPARRSWLDAPEVRVLRQRQRVQQATNAPASFYARRPSASRRACRRRASRHRRRTRRHPDGDGRS